MPNLNQVMIMGNLTRDPELRYTPNNTAVANIGIAVNRKWRNQEGQSQEETTFVDCEAWGRTAEVMNEYLRKGRPVYVQGRLRLDQWQDKEGNNRSKLKVVVENFQFLDSRGGEGADEASRPPAGRSSNPPAQAPGLAPAEVGADQPHQAVNEQDIPF
jgi:single-strand DNA-binding protein